MTAALFLAAILSVADPAGDAFGNGTVTLPSAVVFRTPSAFDARRIDVLDTTDFAFSLQFDSLGNPWNLENGFSLPVIEVYLDSGDGGSTELLPGSGMRLAPGETWNYAFRITGDSFEVYQARGDGEPALITRDINATLTVEGNNLTVHTLLPRPRRFSLYAMVGSYDPFSETGWRPLHDNSSPWSLSSEDQNVPVLDVLAERFSTQQRAINSGVLPEIRASVQYNGWLVLTVIGAVIGLLGVLGRIFRRTSVQRTPVVTATAEASTDEEQPTERYTPLYLPQTVDATPGSEETETDGDRSAAADPSPTPADASRAKHLDTESVTAAAKGKDTADDEITEEFDRDRPAETSSADTGDARTDAAVFPSNPERDTDIDQTESEPFEENDEDLVVAESADDARPSPEFWSNWPHAAFDMTDADQDRADTLLKQEFQRTLSEDKEESANDEEETAESSSRA